MTSLTKERKISLGRVQKAAYVEALTLLNSNKKRNIAKQFSTLIGIYRLRFSRGVGPTFSPVSKKDLLGEATKFTKLSDELAQSMKKFFVLGMPASLAVRHTDEMQEYFLENLQILAKDLGQIHARTQRIIRQIEGLEQKRMIFPLPAIGQSFDIDLAELWVKAGHKLSSTAEGPTALFFVHAYEAATGKERETVVRALSNALKFIKSGMKRPTSAQIQRAARARLTATFDEIRRDRRQG